MQLVLVVDSSAQFTDTIGKPIINRNQQFYHATLKTNLLPILWGNIPMTGEYRLVYEFSSGMQSSFEISGSILGKSLLLMAIEDTITSPAYSDWVIKGFRFQIGYKYYLTRLAALKGLYIAPFFSYANAKFSTTIGLYTKDYLQATHLDYNLNLGYQFINERIVFDIFFGIGLRKKIWVENSSQSLKPFNSNDLYLYNSPVRLIFGFNYGIAF